MNAFDSRKWNPMNRKNLPCVNYFNGELALKVKLAVICCEHGMYSLYK